MNRGSPLVKRCSIMSCAWDGSEEASIRFGYASPSTHLDGIVIKAQGLNYGDNFIPFAGMIARLILKEHMITAMQGALGATVSAQCSVVMSGTQTKSVFFDSLCFVPRVSYRTIVKFRSAVYKREGVSQGATKHYFSRRYITTGAMSVTQL